jgi:hypothetical protein
MPTHRFTGYLAAETPAGVRADAVPAGSAFILVPCLGPPEHQTHAELLYRVAWEQAQAQVASERRARRMAFSLN